MHDYSVIEIHPVLTVLLKYINMVSMTTWNIVVFPQFSLIIRLQNASIMLK